MYYVLHDRKKKAPLHVMAAHNIHDKCKNRELITTFNHIGVSMSCIQVQRAKSELAQYTLQQCEKLHVSLPSHFSKEMFTLAAFDNFDHQDRSSPSGTKSNHDTVMTLFQEKPNQSFQTSQIFCGYGISITLPCQKLLPYKGVRKQLPLDPSFSVDMEIFYKKEKHSKSDSEQLLINFIRNGILCNKPHSNRPTCDGCESLSSSSNLPKMHTGFFPYIPHPVTKHPTV